MFEMEIHPCFTSLIPVFSEISQSVFLYLLRNEQTSDRGSGIKVSLALIQSKEALHDFTKNVIDDLHHDIKTKVGSGTCDGTCNTPKCSAKEPSCPSCVKWVKEIKAQTKGKCICWKNADKSKWHGDPWEMAKCWMNPQGDMASAAAVTAPDKTDLSGMLNLLINCKEFNGNHIKEIKLAEHVRTVRNHLMHCASMSFEEAKMKDMIDQIIALLEDDKELKHLVICQKTVESIELLKDHEFELKKTDEHACIETALESHVLDAEAAESEEEIDKDMILKLSQLIMENKDLGNKFDAKVTKLKEEYDTRFSIVDKNISYLGGRVEYIEKQLQRTQSLSNNSASSVGHEMKSFYKNALQSYAHKKSFELPKYDFEQIESGLFVSTVLIDGEEFKSSESKPTKKDADQSAAEQALKSLRNKELELPSTKSKPQIMNTGKAAQFALGVFKRAADLNSNMERRPTNKPAPDETDTGTPGDDSAEIREGATSEGATSGDGKTCNAKSELNEYAQGQGAKPSYQLIQVLDDSFQTSFRSKVTVLGKTFECVGSYSTKRMSEQMAAAEAMKYFNAMLYEDNSSATTSATNFSKIFPVDCAKRDDSTRANVEEGNMTWEISSKVLFTNSTQDTNESTEREACKGSQATPGDLRAADLNSNKERRPTNEPASGETDTGTLGNDSAEIGGGASSGDRKTYNAKSELNEYAQGQGTKPSYEPIQVSDDSSPTSFRSKVTVLDKTFECVGSYSTKRMSEQMAAAEAMKYFNAMLYEERRPTNEPASDETDTGTLGNDSAELSGGATGGDGKTCNAKSELNEYAQGQGTKPSYEPIQVSDDSSPTSFRSKVTVLGKTFECVESYSTKRMSEQMAAAEAMKYFNAMLYEDNSSATTSAKNFPKIFPVGYAKTDDSTRTNVEEGNMTCEISSKVLFTNNTQDTNELTEREACKDSEATPKDLRQWKTAADLNSNRERRPTNEPASDETDTGTLGNHSAEIGGGASSGDRKTCNAKSELNEYAQGQGTKPSYEPIQVSDDSFQTSFRSKVTVLGKTFECVGSYSTKRISEQMAAAEAMKYFNGVQEGNSSAAHRHHNF